MTTRRRMVIIGAGFGGLNLMKHLDRKQWEVVVVDANNYHSFPPLFYQVASSGLEPASISFPMRREMRRYQKHGWRFHLGRVHTIDTRRKVVSTQYEDIPYDSLVIAAGCTNNFFNMPELRKSVFTMKSTAEAMRARNEILDRLERACVTADPDERRRLLSFTVIGGGPTGVEVAGAIGEMKRYIIPREYPALKQDEVTITLVEGRDRLLAAMDTSSSAHALEYLGHLMVDVKLSKMMHDYTDSVIHFTDGTELYSQMVIWTAGITGQVFTLEGTDVKAGPGGRFIVDEYNRVEGLEDVYAIGDIALHTDEEYPRGCPQLAQVAIQQGRTLARNLKKGFTQPFRYNNKGTMATVGRNRAVVEIGRFHMSGFPAWLTWMFIHLISILGMRNRLTVLINWIWAYFTYGSSLRLLFRVERYPTRSYHDDLAD